MRVETVRDMALGHGMRLPDSLRGAYPPRLSAADERGWFRFQRLYDAARHCVRGEADMRRIVREAALDDGAEGSRWLEIQVDPTSYAPFVGGITPAMEIVLDEARSVNSTADETGSARVGVLMAASRIRHPLEARTLARLAAQYAGPDGVVGFGLSNDERRGDTPDFAPAFRIAERAGLALVPHAGELLGPESVAETLATLRPDRLGHGVRSTEDPRVLAAIVEAGVALEVCPGSNVSLGVYREAPDVPLRALLSAGATIALGADDPLLFDSRLLAQYETARIVHGLADPEIAELARSSFRASRAPQQVVDSAVADIDAWLAAPA
ncbi:MAG: adenosine deaminase [Janibacter sp.]|nr:adenosine deaminase [Janibacter sp.]